LIIPQSGDEQITRLSANQQIGWVLTVSVNHSIEEKCRTEQGNNNKY